MDAVIALLLFAILLLLAILGLLFVLFIKFIKFECRCCPGGMPLSGRPPEEQTQGGGGGGGRPPEEQTQGGGGGGGRPPEDGQRDEAAKALATKLQALINLSIAKGTLTREDLEREMTDLKERCG